MINTGTLATLDTPDTGRGQKNPQKTKKMSNTNPTKNRDEPKCSRRV